MLGYNADTYVRVDTDRKNLNDPNNIWKIVTRDERNTLMEQATEETPVDASHIIMMPNFSQREYGNDAWMSTAWNVNAPVAGGSIGIWRRMSNYPDFAFECWSEPVLDLFQLNETDALIPGWYTLSVQGFYRDGAREHHAALLADGGQPARRATLSVGEGDAKSDIPLRSIDTVDVTLGDKATGWSDDTNYYAWPDNVESALAFFQHGAYKNTVTFELKTGGNLEIVVSKTEGAAYEEQYEEDGETKTRTVNKDWVVLDNFRLTYLGADKPTGIDGVTDNTSAPARKGIFNLQGQMLEKPAKGVNIINGKKVIIK